MWGTVFYTLMGITGGMWVKQINFDTETKAKEWMAAQETPNWATTSFFGIILKGE